MTIIGGLILAVCGIAAIIFSIQILIMNFQENVLWGIASLLFGLPGLIFVIMRWDKAGKPFLMSLAANFGVFVGSLMMAMGSGS